VGLCSQGKQGGWIMANHWASGARKGVHCTASLQPHNATTVCSVVPCALQVSPGGEVLQCLMDPDGRQVSTISSVTEHQGRLFLGNLGGDFVSVLQLHQLQPPQAQAASAAAAAEEEER